MKEITRKTRKNTKQNKKYAWQTLQQINKKTKKSKKQKWKIEFLSWFKGFGDVTMRKSNPAWFFSRYYTKSGVFWCFERRVMAEIRFEIFLRNGWQVFCSNTHAHAHTPSTKAIHTCPRDQIHSKLYLAADVWLYGI